LDLQDSRVFLSHCGMPEVLIVLVIGRLLKCEPIDSGRFVADLTERHLDYWATDSDVHSRERNSKRSTHHQWCALRGLCRESLQRAPWSHMRHTSFPDLCFLTFLVTLFAVWHASDFVPTPYKLEQWPGLTTSPTCAMLMTYTGILAKCAARPFSLHHPSTRGLCPTYASLFHPAGFNNVSAFLSQNTIRSTSSFVHF